MTTQFSHHRSRHWMAAGQAGARLGRLATVLAAVISGLLAPAAAATAAVADPKIEPKLGRRQRTVTMAGRSIGAAGRPDTEPGLLDALSHAGRSVYTRTDSAF
jgi:hypothetical protein